MENNKVSLIGVLLQDATYSHSHEEERFFRTIISIERTSGVFDEIPVIISERHFDITKIVEGAFVSVIGEFRSKNCKDPGATRKLILSVFAREIDVLQAEIYGDGANEIVINGFVCKAPVYRTTPKGKEITNLTIAVNRTYSASDYIPCITWGKAARFSRELQVSELVKIKGRIQSREYSKTYDDATKETKVAYEVSVSEINYVEDENL